MVASSPIQDTFSRPAGGTKEAKISMRLSITDRISIVTRGGSAFALRTRVEPPPSGRGHACATRRDPTSRLLFFAGAT
eukprot:6102842-Prymnesium_polylepis.1